jgi:hypothetical protein
MKTLILQFLLLFFTYNAFAQIILEHTYDDNSANRIKLEYSGEKYYLFKKSTNELFFYNADHTLWKTIVLPASPSNQFSYPRIFHVSEAKINPDANLEIIFGYYNSGITTYECKIISESGLTLLTIPNVSEAYLSEIPGLSDKLITRNNTSNVISKVYSVPEFVLENTYAEGNISRIKFENSGEKYYLLDIVNSNAKIYNQNHSLWKTVSLPKPTTAIYTNIDVISETQTNPDALLEIGYSYSITTNNSTQYESKIVNENNLILLTIPNSSRLQISSLEGLQDKLIAENINNYVYGTSVYNLPTLSLENVYESRVTRVKLENSGEKYYTSLYPLNNQVIVYNSNYTLWKTINLPLPFNMLNNAIRVSAFSENIINPDALIELVYTYSTGLLSGYEYSSRVINENGDVLLEAEYVQDLYSSEIKGLKNKLIGYNFNPFKNSYIGKVYSLGTLGIADFNKKSNVFIAPNPAKSFLHINTSIFPIIEAEIYNLNGVLVKRETSQNISKIDIEKLPTGIYIVNLTDSNNQKSTHKITVLH